VIRFIVRTGILLVANAVGLLVAAALLEGMKVDLGSYLLAVVVFTVAFVLMQPFLASQLERLRRSEVSP
jgi:putative membrane protein